MIQFSVIVPVYRRNDEMQELLESLKNQTEQGFELLVMEAPSDAMASELCDAYRQYFPIKHVVEDSSRSARRNKGIEMAKGDYMVLFDSDVILPPQYFSVLRKTLTDNDIDCFGGPDSANESFNDIQKAVNYAMTSIMTTGGIRGGMKKLDKFLPRAFNMGFKKCVYDKVGGYREMIGEDTDLSMRIKEAGFNTRLIPDAVVVHKRRVTLKKFYRQVYTFGKARVLLTKLHPGSLKLMHLFPTCFALGCIALIVLAIVHCWLWILPLFLFALLVFVESFVKNKSFKVAVLSIATSYAQLCGYGFGLIDELITRRASHTAAEQLYRQ